MRIVPASSVSFIFEFENIGVQANVTTNFSQIYRAIYYEECVSIFRVIKFLKQDVPFVSLLWLMFYIRSHWYVYIH